MSSVALDVSVNTCVSLHPPLPHPLVSLKHMTELYQNCPHLRQGHLSLHHPCTMSTVAKSSIASVSTVPCHTLLPPITLSLMSFCHLPCPYPVALQCLYHYHLSPWLPPPVLTLSLLTFLALCCHDLTESLLGRLGAGRGESNTDRSIFLVIQGSQG